VGDEKKPQTAEELRVAMQAMEARTDSLTHEEIEQYMGWDRDLSLFAGQSQVAEIGKRWDAPRISIRPASVVKGTRDDGRYTFDRFLRGDRGAANELQSYSLSDGSQRRQDDRGMEYKTIRWPIKNGHPDIESYAQTETTTGGGYLVPTVTQPIMVKITKAFGGLSARASHINTNNGAPINFPSIDDTANSAAVAAINAAPGSGGADLVFGQVALGAFKYAATGTGQAGLKVPRELIDDALFDVTSLVTEMLGVRLARKMAALYTQGVGTTEPVGLFHFTSVSTAAWVLSTGLVQATANQQLQAFIHNLDPSYVTENACWVMNWGTHGTMSGFVDSTNRPLMVSYSDSGLSEPMSFRLLGFPVVIDQGVPNFSLTNAANPASVNTAYAAFGDFEQAFVIRDVQGIGIAVDPYGGLGTNDLLYSGYARTDSAVKNANAYELLPGYHA
jgi:HK97 family phage major capsid protein